jgi:predicted amidophosphoribosyltransferase
MKKCPYCGAELSDESLFCTECGKELSKNNMCPHCGASVNDGDVFCMECGKKIDEVPTTTTKQPKCPHCGACVNEGDVYCMECGKAINEKPTTIAFEEVKEETPPPLKVKPCPYCGKMIEENDVSCNHCGRLLVEGVEEEIEKKTLIDYLPHLLGVVVVLAFIGGAWWLWDSSNKRVEREKVAAAREAFVKDSLRQDSIIKEKARQDSLENARIEMLRKPYLALLDKYGAHEEDWGTCYFLYDITGDSIPEIWMSVYVNEELEFRVYSCLNGEAKLLYKNAEGNANNCSFHYGDNYVLQNYAHMGSQTIDKFTYNKGVIKKVNVFTLEAESLQEAQYEEVVDPLITTYELKDKSPIYELK